MRTMKKILIITGVSLALCYVLGGGCELTAYAQEGPTIDEQGGEIPTQSDISDKLNTTEQSDISDTTETIEPLPDLEKLSDAMNDSFQNYKDNLFEIGGNRAYKKIVKGTEYCFLENTPSLDENLKGLLDCALLAYIPKDKNLGYPSIIVEAIEEGFKEVLSLFEYPPAEMDFLRYFRGKDGCAYLKADPDKIKQFKQNKEE